MKFVYKVVVLIMLQITIIITSFLIVAYLESQKTLAGHVINTAGKNRVLASQVEIELYHFVLNNVRGDAPSTSEILNSAASFEAVTTYTPQNVFDALAALETNIYILKHGGSASGAEIRPISPQFEEDWQEIAGVFEQYYDTILSLMVRQDITIRDIEDAEQVGVRLIVLSDTLTEKLSDELEVFSSRLMVLQVLLGVVNVAIHVAMIWLILRIFDRHAKEKIEREKFTVLGEFASVLAHDMRNPLGTIYNSINLISRNVGDDRGRKEVNRINRSIKRMSHQIDGVLNYVKTPRLDLESHSLGEMLGACIKDMGVPDNVRLNLPEGDTAIYCDAKKMEFVFTNLILNAVQAIGRSPGHITVAVKEDLPDRVTVSFENSGDAIPEEHMKKIFEPLYTTKMHGTGLGLTSCRNIIEVHNGTISASNDPVTFTISLPRGGGR